jgi:hypothetical protein
MKIKMGVLFSLFSLEIETEFAFLSVFDYDDFAL